LDKKLEMLKDLYELRVMTVGQLARRHNYTLGTMYHKVSGLRKSGLILTGDIKGFTVDGGRRGKYYRISNKGVSFLAEYGYEVVHKAEDLKVSDYRVPILLETNDMIMDFASHGWFIKDSRVTKNIYDLNRGDNLHGLLTSPAKSEYPFYIFLNNTSDRHISRIRKEVNRYNFSDIILFVNSSKVFSRVFVEMLQNADFFTYR